MSPKIVESAIDTLISSASVNIPKTRHKTDFYTPITANTYTYSNTWSTSTFNSDNYIASNYTTTVAPSGILYEYMNEAHAYDSNHPRNKNAYITKSELLVARYARLCVHNGYHMEALKIMALWDEYYEKFKSSKHYWLDTYDEFHKKCNDIFLSLELNENSFS